MERALTVTVIVGGGEGRWRRIHTRIRRVPEGKRNVGFSRGVNIFQMREGRHQHGMKGGTGQPQRDVLAGNLEQASVWRVGLGGAVKGEPGVREKSGE